MEDDLDAPAELAAAVLEPRLYTMEVDVPNVLDLRPAAARERIGLTNAHLHSEVSDYRACNAVAAAAHQLSLGNLASAATELGETLALFALNVDATRWPTITGSQIWDGLPADPRRLRLADDAV